MKAFTTEDTKDTEFFWFETPAPFVPLQ